MYVSLVLHHRVMWSVWICRKDSAGHDSAVDVKLVDEKGEDVAVSRSWAEQVELSDSEN